ncbi:MAG: hypothetical protein HN368_03770 [Spirochaetales bacterium]|jgi:hypothetical protein|nr:hypothetical protein [Spirochaetales bacterium]
MLESLPEETQNRIVEHLRDYLDDLSDEMKWDHLFENTQGQLVEAARRAKREMAQGKSQPLDLDQL